MSLSPLDDFLRTLSPSAQGFVRACKVEAPQPIAIAWHLLEVPDGDAPRLSEHPTLESVAARMRFLGEELVQCFIFGGVSVALTEPPHVYLVHPNGQLIPMAAPPSLRISTHHYISSAFDDLVGVDPATSRAVAELYDRRDAADVDDDEHEIEDDWDEGEDTSGWSDEDDAD